MMFSLRLSLQVAACAAVLVLVVGTAMAYLLARKEFRGKQLLDLLLTLPLVLPPVVTGYYLVLLLGRNGLLGAPLDSLSSGRVGIMFSWYGAVLASFTVSLPLMVKTARTAIESVDPELIQMSYTLGRSERDTALRIVLPLARPGILAGLTLAIARGLGEFGATIMLAGNLPGKTNTMPLEIYNRVVYGEWGDASLFVAFFTLASGSFLLLANRLGRARFI